MSVNGKMVFIHSALETVWQLHVCVSSTRAKQKWILKNARSLPDGCTQHLTSASEIAARRGTQC